MTQEYTNFREKEMSDGTYLVAEPTQPNGEQLRIEVGWFDIEPGEKGKWEDIVGTIVRNDLRKELQLQQGGKGTIECERAIENIMDADPEDGQPIESREQAAAIIDYFIEEGALTVDENNSNEIVVLHDPMTLNDEDATIEGDRSYQILSWAAAVDACISYMEETLDTFEQARERLNNRLEDKKQADDSKAEKKAVEKAQELKNLGPGSEVPDPSELSDSERQRYETLKEDYAYFKKLYEVEQKKLGTAEEGIEKLARNIDRLEAAKGTYGEKVEEIRTWALQRQIFPEDAIGIADNMAETITVLSGIESHQEMADSMDVDELNDDIGNFLGESSEVAGAVSQGIEDVDEADIEEPQDIQME